MRRALGPAGRDLATLEGGYRLTVPRGGLDVCRFEDALATAARLEELRAAAAERQAELQLSLGRAEEAVAALGALLAEHPEREQARGLPMQTLYRTGRETGALATIRSWRRHLATELGLDPSPALQAIEQDILRHTAGTPDTRGAAAPLPLPVTSFVGRDEELVAVTARLDRARLVTLHGPHAVVRAVATAAGLSERAFRRLDDQLKQTRGVTLLATSRERLEVDGEHVWQVRPLPVSGHDAPGRRAGTGSGRCPAAAGGPRRGGHLSR